MKPLFVTGIGTGVGKTVISAILTERYQADYWKPVQSGDLDCSDTMKVRSLVSNPLSRFHPEAYRLTQPLSPHKSASLDGISISPDQIILPQTTGRLIIEGAGGLMVPLNENFFMIDLIRKFDAEAVLVVKHYLGSINHTLLSLAMLQNYRIPVNRLVINGGNDSFSEQAILRYAHGTPVESIPEAEVPDKAFIRQYARMAK